MEIAVRSEDRFGESELPIETGAPRIRVALALLRGTAKRPERDLQGVAGPRSYLFEDKFSSVFDELTLAEAPRFAKRVYRHLPPWMRLALEVHRRRAEYDVIVTWGEKISLGLATLQCVLPSGNPHVPLWYWFSKPNVRFPLQVVSRSIHAFITWSSVQREWAIENLGWRPERIPLVKHFVDQQFWTPTTASGPEMICSAGSEMRDYATLIEALRSTDIPCHVAAERVRVPSRSFRHGTLELADIAKDAPRNFTWGPKNPVELRDLYARSRFVVLPIQPSDTDNGVTVMLEAMACGKAVIASRTKGQVDVLQDGVTGLYVPVGDPVALRDAIQELWNDTERARDMGVRARKWVEEHHSLEKFAERIHSLASETRPDLVRET